MPNPLQKLIDLGVSHHESSLSRLRQRTINVVNAFYVVLMAFIILVRLINTQYIVALTNSLFFALILLSIVISYKGRLALSVALSGWVVVTQPFLLSYFKLLPAFQLLPQLVLLMGVFQIASPNKILRSGSLCYCLILLAVVSMSQGFSFVESIPFLLQIGVIGVAVSYYVSFLERQDSSLNSAIVDLQKTNSREHSLNHSLAEKNAELKMYTDIMSHDLRSPLQEIMTSSEIISANPSSHKDVRMYSEQILQSALSIRRLINDLLLRSKVDMGSSEEFEQVDLKQIVDEVVLDLYSAIIEQKVDVQISDLPTIKGDMRLLKAMFHNLISNAIKFQPINSPDHSPILKIRFRPGWEGRSVIHVQDNGIGIPDDLDANRFEPFKRFHADDYEGIGLGLSICHRIMSIHNGELKLIQTTKEGSCFQLTFNSSMADFDVKATKSALAKKVLVES